MNDNRGVLISCEGPDGSGKSTNVIYLTELLVKRGFRVLSTREPGGTEVGEMIREIVLNSDMHAKTELLLFAASRNEHIERKIKPALEKGYVVITDRFCDSSMAYQGYGRGLIDQVKKLEEFVHLGFYPDHTLFFDIPFETCNERLRRRTDKQDRIDQEEQDFKQRVWTGYQAQFNDNPRRMYRIDANAPLEKVKERLQNWVGQVFKPIHQHLISQLY